MLFGLLEKSLDFSDRDREVIQMRFQEDKTVEEISLKFGVPGINIYKQIERIIKRLKKTLEAELKGFV
jgi:RNA polymerase sigma factor (sigma-70 family)